jgi:putative ABC transport system ATP-binding protein
VFADEPTGALDAATGHEVMSVLVRATQEAGAALVVVTHDDAVARWCGRVVTMGDGRLIGERRTAPATQTLPGPVAR